MFTPLTDREIVERALKNPDDYELIIDRFGEQIVRYIGRMTGASHEEVEEIAQMVFIRAYRSLNGFDADLKFSSWLYRIAHNLSVDFLRKNKKRTTASLDANDEESFALIEKIATDENIAVSFSEDMTKQGVRDIISLLPEKYQTVLVLFFLEEKSYEEISDILQMPTSTVGTLISRAKKQFLALSEEPQFSHLFTYASTQA